MTAYIGRSEAVFEVRSRVQAIGLPIRKCPQQHSLEAAKILSAAGFARGGRAAVRGWRQFERDRLCGSHPPRHQPQARRAMLHGDDRPYQVALLAPELKDASAMRFGD